MCLNPMCSTQEQVLDWAQSPGNKMSFGRLIWKRLGASGDAEIFEAVEKPTKSMGDNDAMGSRCPLIKS